MFQLQHRMVVRIDRILLPIREQSGIWDPVDVDVEERHENADHQALGFVPRIAQRIAHAVRFALDVDDRFIRTNRPLVQDDAVRRREEVTGIGIAWTDRIAKEVMLGKPTDRPIAKWTYVCSEPLFQLLRHKEILPADVTVCTSPARTVPRRWRRGVRLLCRTRAIATDSHAET